MDRTELIKKNYNAVRLVGFAMIGSLFFYWMVARFVAPASSSTSQEPVGILRVMFYFLASASFPGILMLKKLFLQKKPQNNLTILLGKLTISSISVMALCETPAVYGLILYFVGGSRLDFYILGAYSLLLFAVFFPRFSQWQEYTSGTTS